MAMRKTPSLPVTEALQAELHLGVQRRRIPRLDSDSALAAELAARPRETVYVLAAAAATADLHERFGAVPAAAMPAGAPDRVALYRISAPAAALPGSGDDEVRY